jgi:hypothetical protein
MVKNEKAIGYPDHLTLGHKSTILILDWSGSQMVTLYCILLFYCKGFNLKIHIFTIPKTFLQVAKKRLNSELLLPTLRNKKML